MTQIPTAEEFFNKNYEPLFNQAEATAKIMIEFAKLHVEAALKEASEKQVITAFYEEWNKEETELIMDEDDNYEATYKGPVLSGGKVYVVDKESILKSYQITNII